jgi:small subunit ribosomal protein S1
MVNNRSKDPVEGMEPLDEAWWSALLAEEERYSASRPNSHGGDGHIEPRDAQFYGSSRPVGVDWDYVESLFARDETIALTVSGYNRGGLLVEGKGIHGFVPISHLVKVNCDTAEEDRDLILAEYVGRPLQLKVIECEPSRGRVVFSERAALASAGRRNQLLSQLMPGNCVRGIVTNITDFGIFVDLGGVEGLVHVSEISWGRVRHPGDAVSVGQEVTAYVIQVDKERTRIALSLKRLCDNPWEYAEQRYRPGQIVQAVVTSVVPFGAFARLEEGLDGLVHATEMSESGPVIPAEILEEGQQVTVRILHIDAARQRLGLSMILNR